MCTVYTGSRQAGRQAVSCERGAASLVHEGDAATLGHVTEGVSRETSLPTAPPAYRRPSTRPTFHVTIRFS